MCSAEHHHACICHASPCWRGSIYVTMGIMPKVTTPLIDYCQVPASKSVAVDLTADRRQSATQLCCTVFFLPEVLATMLGLPHSQLRPSAAVPTLSGLLMHVMRCRVTCRKLNASDSGCHDQIHTMYTSVSMIAAHRLNTKNTTSARGPAIQPNQATEDGSPRTPAPAMNRCCE
eukprot:GHUV01014917.1.p2 GENE.GHUV01014917.1~~GHUV01014917.1.p2  ORF type:complete len:174 (-),score=32.81 GHUV01014917.1:1095-1616(-)